MFFSMADKEKLEAINSVKDVVNYFLGREYRVYKGDFNEATIIDDDNHTVATINDEGEVYLYDDLLRSQLSENEVELLVDKIHGETFDNYYTVKDLKMDLDKWGFDLGITETHLDVCDNDFPVLSYWFETEKVDVYEQLDRRGLKALEFINLLTLTPYHKKGIARRYSVRVEKEFQGIFGDRWLAITRDGEYYWSPTEWAEFTREQLDELIEKLGGAFEVFDVNTY
mgnify:CR=1 FL=1